MATAADTLTELGVVPVITEKDKTRQGEKGELQFGDSSEHWVFLSVWIFKFPLLSILLRSIVRIDYSVFHLYYWYIL